MPEAVAPVPAQLRAARRRAGLTQEQTARAVGRTLSTYVRYEAGAVNPPPEVLGTLAALFGATIDHPPA